MKSMLLYCYFWKFFKDSTLDIESLKKKLVESEAENAKLKEMVTWQDEELLLTFQQ
jgi:hypothetical protein